MFELPAWLQKQSRLNAGAILLVAPAGFGKRVFAENRAAGILCENSTEAALPCGHCRSCRLMQTANHPDCLILCPDENAQSIKIEQVRALAHWTSTTAHYQQGRVVIIDRAHQLMTASANALLKTLEEPLGNCKFIVLADELGSVIPTLRSRCLVQRMHVTHYNEVESYWCEHGVAQSSLQLLWNILGHAPLKAVVWYEQGYLEQYSCLSDDIKNVMQRKINCIEVATRWAKWPIDQVMSLLNTWIQQTMRAVVLEQQPGDIIGLFAVSDKINLQQRQLGGVSNLNAQLAWCALLANFQQLKHSA